MCQNSFLSKICDTILHIQLKKYLNDNELESPHQAGYKENNSCETLVNALYDQMYADYDNNKVQILFALDYSSAFDCLRQDQLLEIFEKEFKIKYKALSTMKTYFKGRSYTIDIEGVKSNEQKLLIGSGQGSILSSLGFALDINQLSLIPHKLGHQCFQYADDVTIRIVFDRNESQENVKKMAIEVLNEILKFSISHGLALIVTRRKT